MADKARTIRGSIDGSVLTRAAQFFSLSLGTIISEVLQNARRASATKVVVTTEKTGSLFRVTIADDGNGVPDFNILTTFGASGWSDDSSPAEDRAGMGLFSLAAYGCVVSSMGRRAELSPEVFRGQAEAAITKVPFSHGTTVSFSLPRDVERGENPTGLDFMQSMVQETLFYPIPVELDGTLLRNAIFMSHAEWVTDHAGVRIGVHGEATWARWCDEHDLALPSGGVTDGGFISFGGHLVQAPFAAVDEDGHEWRVLIEVGEGASMKLKLPMRDAVVRDGAWTDVMAAMAASLCRERSRSGGHRLPMELVALARSTGEAVEDPELHLRPFAERYLRLAVLGGDGRRGTMESMTGGRASDAILVPPGWRPQALDALLNLAVREGWGGRLARWNGYLAGVTSYDALPRIIRIDVIVGENDGRTVWMEGFERPLSPTVTGPEADSAADHQDRSVAYGWSTRARTATRRHAEGAPRTITVVVWMATGDGLQQLSGEIDHVFAHSGQDGPDEAVFATGRLERKDIRLAAGRYAALWADEIAARHGDDEHWEAAYGDAAAGAESGLRKASMDSIDAFLAAALKTGEDIAERTGMLDDEIIGSITVTVGPGVDGKARTISSMVSSASASATAQVDARTPRSRERDDGTDGEEGTA